MGGPQSIDPNILDVYVEREQQGGWHSERRTLAHSCIQAIAANWINAPVGSLPLEGDTATLLEQVSRQVVPLRLLVSRLPHEAYWRGAHGVSLEAYLERYTREYLEGLHPREYDPQEISLLVGMCGPVLRRLQVRHLTAGDRLPAQPYRDMIPLGSVLSGLGLLTHLTMSLGLRGRGGEWDLQLRRLSPQQLRRIAEGIRQCQHLQVISITRSDIDCDKVSTLLDALLDLSNLRSVNLSHCRIADHGAKELTSFLLQKPSLKELLLVNNRIGPPGAECLAYALCQPQCKLQSLDLSCNTVLGPAGVQVVLTALLRGTLLNKLKISACGVYGGDGVGGVLAACLAAGRSPLRELDISNNYLGQESGGAVLAAIEGRGSSGPSQLGVRGCGLGRWGEAIQRATLRTAARRRVAQVRFRGGARRLLQANRIARAIGIDDVDPLQIARQLTARPSAASLPLSLTLSLSLDQDPLLHDLPTSPKDLLHIAVPPLKNPFCAVTPVQIRQRRFSYPLFADGEKRKEKKVRRNSEGAKEKEEVEGGSKTNISIHVKGVRAEGDGQGELPKKGKGKE